MNLIASNRVLSLLLASSYLATNNDYHVNAFGILTSSRKTAFSPLKMSGSDDDKDDEIAMNKYSR